MRFFTLDIKNKCITDIFIIKEQLATMGREIDLLCRAISKTQSENNILFNRISKLETSSTPPITGAPTKPKRNTRATPRKRARSDKH